MAMYDHYDETCVRLCVCVALVTELNKRIMSCKLEGGTCGVGGGWHSAWCFPMLSHLLGGDGWMTAGRAVVDAVCWIWIRMPRWTDFVPHFRYFVIEILFLFGFRRTKNNSFIFKSTSSDFEFSLLYQTFQRTIIMFRGIKAWCFEVFVFCLFFLIKWNDD